ncbi:DUF2642 domain-containing protein [Marininema halotolerans]|uniref:DUF2642 domain-containing protein n=1 Tax=Marininema halotolerans TaxID=1155944 RepID=UPI000B860B88|nr:DUF2642 domain-containing protein [Marininema halotolerans]
MTTNESDVEQSQLPASSISSSYPGGGNGQLNAPVFPYQGYQPKLPWTQPGMQPRIPWTQPGMMPGMQPGMMPGMQPGMMPGMQPGMMPGMQPGMMPGMQPGMMPGMQPGMMPGMQPGMMPGMQPGMMPGMMPMGFMDEMPPMGPGLMPPFPPEAGKEEGGLKSPLARMFRGRGRRGRGFLAQHMSQVIGQDVQIETYVGSLEGEVISIHPDHMIVEKDDRKIHVRWDAIVYVSPMEKK